MITIQVFEPALCCASGACGPAVDPHLSRFAGDVAWLQSSGVRVQRFNLAQHPGEFARDATVAQELGGGLKCLPLVFVDGELRSRGRYPARSDLAQWAGISLSSPTLVVESPCSGDSQCC